MRTCSDDSADSPARPHSIEGAIVPSWKRLRRSHTPLQVTREELRRRALDPSQLVDQEIRHSVGVEFPLGVARGIAKRKHGEPLDVQSNRHLGALQAIPIERNEEGEDGNRNGQGRNSRMPPDRSH